MFAMIWVGWNAYYTNDSRGAEAIQRDFAGDDGRRGDEQIITEANAPSA